MSSRSQAIEDLFRCGRTMQEVGDAFGISRERVRQILVSAGVPSSCGGRAKRTSVTDAKRTHRRNEAALRRYGCTFVELSSVPARARLEFKAQRRNANLRGIPFLMTLWQWWSVWQESEKYAQRGRRSGQFVMARFGDAGAYEVGNVVIKTCNENISESYVFRPYETRLRSQAVREPRPAKRGYSRMGKRFGVRMGGGWTGDWFDTPEEARAKYLERFAEKVW